MPGHENKIRIAVATLGCKVNQYESAGIARKLAESGFDLVPFNAEADIYIVNTCTVTERTDYQSRQLIRRANRMNPRAPIVVTGCYAQISPEKILALPGVVAVAGTEQKESLPEAIIASLRAKEGPAAPGILPGLSRGSGFDYPCPTLLPHHTRAFLKIQDGCDSFCSYCIVPYARGRSRSLSPEQVLSRISGLVSLGYKEVVLTGIHLGMYGLELATPVPLPALLRRIEERIPDLPRLRLSSIEPMEVTDDLIKYLAGSEMLCRHFHIPLQSGCNKILTRMKRCYNSQHFKEVIEKIAGTVPGAAIGLDVMAGFPGEEEADFKATLDLISALPVAYLHVFPYSRRAGTEAARLSGQVHERIKKERALILRQLGQQKRRMFNERFMGKRLSVLIEDTPDRKTGLLKGISDNYIPVLVAGPPALKNQLVDVLIERVSENKSYGKIFNGEQDKISERA